MSDYSIALKVFDLRTCGWDELFAEVPKCVQASPQWDKPPLSAIVKLLEDQQCTSAILESPYVDQDTLYDYLHDYGRAFRDTGKYCARIHFFGGDPPSQGANHDLVLDDLARYDSGQVGHKAAENPYLGFMVVRPTGEYCVGRTVLRPPSNNVNQCGNIHALAVYESELCGAKLRVQGTPFMQQDQSSHVCAGVALWILCYDLHRRYNTPRFFPREVSEIATENLSHGRPIKEGLTPYEMGRMLRHVRCGVDLQWFHLPPPGKDRRKLVRQFADTVYGYVHSKLPVLVGYWRDNEPIGHVVLALGHDLCESIQTPTDALPQHQLLRNSDYVSCFQVHNDQIGPYQPLRIWKQPQAATAGTGTNAEFAIEDADEVFLIPGITEAARMFYREALDRVLRTMTQGTRDYLKDTRLRLTFQQARRFKNQLLDNNRGRSPLPGTHLSAYRRLELPRYIYVCDFLVPTDGDPFRRFRTRGEVILDATSPPYGRGESSVLAMRWGKELYIRGAAGSVIASDYGNDPWAPSNVDPSYS